MKFVNIKNAILMNTGVIYILHKFDHIDALPVKY